MDKLAKRIGDETLRKIDVVTADLANRDDLAKLERILAEDSSVTLW
jgi:hypothetical protein